MPTSFPSLLPSPATHTSRGFLIAEHDRACQAHFTDKGAEAQKNGTRQLRKASHMQDMAAPLSPDQQATHKEGSNMVTKFSCCLGYC